MFKIFLDPGHGGSDPGAISPDGLMEKDQVFDIVRRILSQEKGFGGVVKFSSSRTDDTYVSLGDRAILANNWNADYFISVHMNSDASHSGHGIEVYALSTGGKGEQLAKALGEALVYNVGLPFHGQSPKFANLQVLRDSHMPAALCECGFIGTLDESRIISGDTAKQNFAYGVCYGISQFLGIPFSPSIPAPAPTPNPTPDPTPTPVKHPILATAQASPEQARTFLLNNNPSAPDYTQLYVEIAGLLGIRWDFLFAQSIFETNYWRFTGTVTPDQNNFAGLGATQGSTGASFPDTRTGILAQAQHAFAYATNQPLPTGMVVVDPRFSLVPRGTAPNIEDLDGRWAVPGNNYGETILNLMDTIAHTTPAQPPSGDPAATTATLNALIAFLINLANSLGVDLSPAIQKLKAMLPQ